jgi:hypothetical protein
MLASTYHHEDDSSEPVILPNRIGEHILDVAMLADNHSTDPLIPFNAGYGQALDQSWYLGVWLGNRSCMEILRPCRFLVPEEVIDHCGRDDKTRRNKDTPTALGDDVEAPGVYFQRQGQVKRMASCCCGIEFALRPEVSEGTGGHQDSLVNVAGQDTRHGSDCQQMVLCSLADWLWLKCEHASALVCADDIALTIDIMELGTICTCHCRRKDHLNVSMIGDLVGQLVDVATELCGRRTISPVEEERSGGHV